MNFKPGISFMVLRKNARKSLQFIAPKLDHVNSELMRVAHILFPFSTQSEEVGTSFQHPGFNSDMLQVISTSSPSPSTPTSLRTTELELLRGTSNFVRPNSTAIGPFLLASSWLPTPLSSGLFHCSEAALYTLCSPSVFPQTHLSASLVPTSVFLVSDSRVWSWPPDTVLSPLFYRGLLAQNQVAKFST